MATTTLKMRLTVEDEGVYSISFEDINTAPMVILVGEDQESAIWPSRETLIRYAFDYAWGTCK